MLFMYRPSKTASLHLLCFFLGVWRGFWEWQWSVISGEQGWNIIVQMGHIMNAETIMKVIPTVASASLIDSWLLTLNFGVN
jgi:hypothetical protein